MQSSGSSIKTLNTVNNQTGFLGLNSSGWFIDYVANTYQPYTSRVDVFFPGSWTWTKLGNPRRFKIYIVGGGGGGGGGGNKGSNSISALYVGGTGGGAGGVTIIDIDATNIAGATITVGTGGVGGLGATASGHGNVGTSGGASVCSFNNGLIFQATGGKGGYGGYNFNFVNYGAYEFFDAVGGFGSVDNNIYSAQTITNTPGDGL
jgi:hypothetical protein